MNREIYYIFIQVMTKMYLLAIIVIVASASNVEVAKQDGIIRQVSYPIALTYIDRISEWWPPEKIAAGLGVPGYSYKHQYNYIAFAFWSYRGPLDIVKMWSDPIKYFGDASPFGATRETFQKNMKAKYNAAGIKLLISAFGGTQFPTTAGVDPTECAIKLAAFVNENNLDGVDIDWQDNSAMDNGRGQQWLITFQKKLRQLLPNHLIVHAPQAPYFSNQNYRNGGYNTVHKAVGDTIDFYNIQFYNQGNNRYDTYDTLFIQSGGYFSGTSVKEINEKHGVPLNKIVVGKPVTQADAGNTGYIQKTVFAAAVKQAKKSLKWDAGVMFWQFVSDVNGQTIKTVLKGLKHPEQVEQLTKQ